MFDMMSPFNMFPFNEGRARQPRSVANRAVAMVVVVNYVTRDEDKLLPVEG